MPAVTSAGPVAESCSRLGPSPSILSAICLTLRTMSVTSSRTPGEAREFVQHALDLDRGDRGALERATAAPGAASCRASFRSRARAARRRTRRGGGRRPRPACARGVGLLQFLPVLCVDGHVLPLRSGGAVGVPPDKFKSAARIHRGGGTPRRLDAAPLARPHAVVRDRRDVADRGDRGSRPPAAPEARSRGPSPGP